MDRSATVIDKNPPRTTAAAPFAISTNNKNGSGGFEEWRDTYCNYDNPSCKYAWYFAILGVFYLIICVSCLPLLLRLLLQTAIICGTIFGFARFGAAYKIYQRTRLGSSSNNLVKSCIVLRTQLVPENPIPNFPTRCIATIRLLDEDFVPSSSSMHQQHNYSDKNGTTIEDNLIEEEKVSSTNNDDEEGPKVVVAPSDNIQINDHLLVTLLNGDPTKIVYLPQQQRDMKRMIHSGILNFGGVIAVYLLLAHVFMPDVPVAFAPSELVETSLQSSWWCTVDDDSEKDCCSITPIVTLAYNLFVIFNVLAIIASFYYFRLKIKAQQDRQKEKMENQEEPTKENQEEPTMDNNCHPSFGELT